jgi:hypothetical protein
MHHGKFVGFDRPSIGFHRPSIGVRSPLLSVFDRVRSPLLPSPHTPPPIEGARSLGLGGPRGTTIGRKGRKKEKGKPSAESLCNGQKETKEKSPPRDRAAEGAAPSRASARRSSNVGGAFRWGSATAGIMETMKLWLIISLLWSIALGVPLAFLIFAH